MFFVSIDKVDDNVNFICKHFYIITITRKLNLDCHLSNQADNTYKYLNHKTKQQIIKEYKSYLSKHQMNLLINMQYLPPTYWIPKIHKSLISFVIASPGFFLMQYMKYMIYWTCHYIYINHLCSVFSQT